MLSIRRQSAHHRLNADAATREPATLADTWRSGRILPNSEPTRVLLEAMLDFPPRELGLPYAGWKPPLLHET